nr:unnamed protein product [Callosobruchus chinensis]
MNSVVKQIGDKIIFFGYDESSISEVSADALLNVMEVLQDNPDAKVTLTGYTDNRGSLEYNLALGARRADAAKEIMVSCAPYIENRIKTTSKALTVNHGLRSESQKEADFVTSYAKELGAKESFILNWEKQNIKGNIQLQARKVRYKLLAECCKNNNVKCLLVAHHKDDQAEAFLLRLERGSGVDGLSSMDYKSFLNGIYIFGPLLNFSRSEIEKRTLYRSLLKAIDNQEILTERICLTALHMKRAAKALMHYTRLAFNDCVNVHDLGYIEIKLIELYQLPEEIALRLLLYSIMAIASKHYKPRYNSLIAIFNKILQKDSNVNCTLSGCKIRKYGENILIIRESYHCSIKKNTKVPEFLKDYNCCPEVFYSLPTIQKDGKVLAYPGVVRDTKTSIVIRFNSY